MFQNFYQSPAIIPAESTIDGYYARIDGTLNYKNPAPVLLPLKVKPTPVNLEKPYGGIVGGYEPSILRPFDNVSIPTDIKRGSFYKHCNMPDYGGSKFQQWCSQDNAVNYHGMRPIMQPEEYNRRLQKMFNTVVQNNSTPEERKLNTDLTNKWSSVFCDARTEEIMKWLMSRIAETVAVMPEMNNSNGPWKIERFDYTDPQIYQFLSGDEQIFYKIIFSLYNALRSISTVVEVTIIKNNNGNLRVVQMGLVNQGELKSYDNTGGIGDVVAYNLADAGQTKQIETAGAPTSQIQWLYGNSLMKTEFGPYGFYDDENNVKLNIGVSDSLKQKINKFENQSDTYLRNPAHPQFSGAVQNPGTYDKISIAPPSNYATSRMLNPANVIYGKSNGQYAPLGVSYV